VSHEICKRKVYEHCFDLPGVIFTMVNISVVKVLPGLDNVSRLLAVPAVINNYAPGKSL
jgi:hypothetical protein